MKQQYTAEFHPNPVLLYEVLSSNVYGSSHPNMDRINTASPQNSAALHRAHSSYPIHS